MFTIRVYGLLLHQGRVLVSDEVIKGQHVTKFPGGGLEYGEGLKDCLVREIQEEIGVEAYDVRHFYTTEFFQQSAFHKGPMQVVSVYFTFNVHDPSAIPIVEIPFERVPSVAGQEQFRWVRLENGTDVPMSLPIDRVVWGMLLTDHRTKPC